MGRGFSEGTDQKVTKDFVITVKLLRKTVGQIAISRQVEALIGDTKHAAGAHPPESNCGGAVIDRQPAVHVEAFAN